ncbi:hypothetical protein, partial [Xylanibacter rodentium]|uniref:hypothetical protein n=1 Tax=Xylanibacter rodentium TaxID=2736289 RepID=UPI0025953F89
LFWAKGSVQFWPKGANQPDSRGHPTLGFPVSGNIFKCCDFITAPNCSFKYGIEFIYHNIN